MRRCHQLRDSGFKDKFASFTRRPDGELNKNVHFPTWLCTRQNRAGVQPNSWNPSLDRKSSSAHYGEGTG